MDLNPNQYESALRFLKSANDAMSQVLSSCKRREEASRIRRRIEEVEAFLKKVKQELRIG